MSAKQKINPADYDDIADEIVGDTLDWNHTVEEAEQHMSHMLSGKRITDFHPSGRNGGPAYLVFDDGTALTIFDTVRAKNGRVTFDWSPLEGSENLPVTRVVFSGETIMSEKVAIPDTDIDLGMFATMSVVELYSDINDEEEFIGEVIACVGSMEPEAFSFNTRLSLGDVKDINFDDEQEENAENELKSLSLLNKSVTARLTKLCRGASVESYHSTDDLHGMVFYMNNGVSFTVRDTNGNCEFDVLTRDGVEDLPCKKFDYGLDGIMVDTAEGERIAISVLRFYRSKLSKKPSIMLTVIVPDEAPGSETLGLEITFNTDEVN